MSDINLLLATGNAHKAVEIRAILGDRCHCFTLKDFPGAPQIIEDVPTFAGNATKKAVQIARWFAITHHASRITPPASRITFILADDSGLEVDALQGAPGVHSARFATLGSDTIVNATDAANREKLLRLLESVPLPNRTARFRCVLALTPIIEPEAKSASPICYADESELQTELFEGVCDGRIISAPCGQGGFGYDPLFVPDGFDQTFAELGDALKNQFSHRAKALAKLKLRLDGLLPLPTGEG
jgi:XTP/dITP diphosphohydrolase